MDSFLNIFGVFDRVARLREDPLLADIYADVDRLRNSDFPNEDGELDTCYLGPERDRENMLKDKRNMAADFCRAFGAAKQRLGV